MICIDKEYIANNTFIVFCILVVLLIFSWSLVGFYQLFLDTFFYRTLGFCAKNTLDNFIVCILVTALFLIIVWLISKYVLPGTHNRLLGLEEDNVQATVKVEANGLDIPTALDPKGTTSEPLATKRAGLDIGYGGPNNPIYGVGKHP